MNNNRNTLIKLALNEDVGSGDVTSKAIIPKKLRACAKIVTKQDLVLAGVNIAAQVFKMIDKTIQIKIKKKDGENIKKGTAIAEVRGRARSLLAGERTALNFLQHLSGIATLTHKFVKSVRHLSGGGALLDTRKTLPGLRTLEKYAVKMGGGKNHRFGLYDMYLIKNNHVDIAGSVAEAIKRVRRQGSGEQGARHYSVGGQAGSREKKIRRSQLKIEVEVRNLKEFQEAIKGGADIIMLDNFSPKLAKRAIFLAKNAKKRPKIEISGQISLKNVKKYAKLGADYISVGAITHSAPAVDIHMKIVMLQ